jgi:hypothetical protein
MDAGMDEPRETYWAVLNVVFRFFRERVQAAVRPPAPPAPTLVPVLDAAEAAAAAAETATDPMQPLAASPPAL